MKTPKTGPRPLNDIARFLIVNRISGDSFSALTGIERTRVFRLCKMEKDTLFFSLKVAELRSIIRAYPNFEINV